MASTGTTSDATLSLVYYPCCSASPLPFPLKESTRRQAEKAKREEVLKPMNPETVRKRTNSDEISLSYSLTLTTANLEMAGLECVLKELHVCEKCVYVNASTAPLREPHLTEPQRISLVIILHTPAHTDNRGCVCVCVCLWKKQEVIKQAFWPCLWASPPLLPYAEHHFSSLPSGLWGGLVSHCESNGGLRERLDDRYRPAATVKRRGVLGNRTHQSCVSSPAVTFNSLSTTE
ncbi:hypothetical protein QQF64_031672 [Cirrhinus molitorella]|uniref:Uncharacterized protein n=1 Tax=Cirrhinus molitorella TaxID=172907 RepID=A0ABR3MXL3_9TELE